MPLSSLANTQRRQQQPGDVLRFRDAGSASLLVTNPAVNFLGNQMVDGSRERNQENITSSSIKRHLDGACSMDAEDDIDRSRYAASKAWSKT
jgi:hypothetical protein